MPLDLMIQRSCILMLSQCDTAQARKASGSAVIRVTVDHKHYFKTVNKNCQVTKPAEMM